MQGLRRLLKANHNKLTFTAGLMLALVGLMGGALLAANKVSAAAVDCDDNAIIKCGFNQNDRNDFVNKVKANSTSNNHHDLQTFYAHFGFTSADYDNFVKHAVLGTAMRDGSIKVNGKTVLTGGVTYGRSLSAHQPNAKTVNIGGVNYYDNVPNVTFADGVQSIPIYVLFDDQGNFRFAVMPACGNPETGTPKPSSASCTALKATPVSGKANTYSFTASATASGNATLKTFEYNFGDGSRTVTTTNGSTPVTHTYTKSGQFTASVTVHVSVPGNDDLHVSSTTLCTRVITTVSCVQMTGAVLDKSKMSYTFTVTASTGGSGATLTGADFNFGDGNTETDVKPASATTVTVPHTYASPGKYDATATLHFSTSSGTVTAPTCASSVTPETVTPECKPGVPIGSPECIPPCQPGSSVPPESAQCQPPLPNTGAGNTIAIFAAVMVGGFLVYRQILYRKHKAAFVAAQMGTSPLPLGDPLSDQPLEDTPLAVQAKRSFRRKRMF